MRTNRDAAMVVLPKTPRQQWGIWVSVGKQLKARRDTLAWSASAVEQAGGPSSKSVLNHERGRIRRTDLLARHLTVLDLVLVDVLLVACGQPQPVSPDAMQVARLYDRTTEHGKAALLEMARALDVRPAR